MCTTDSGILSILFPHDIKTKKTEKKRKSCNLYKFFVLLEPNLSSNVGIYILQNIIVKGSEIIIKTKAIEFKNYRA